jgi:hypothetical protein
MLDLGIKKKPHMEEAQQPQPYPPHSVCCKWTQHFSEMNEVKNHQDSNISYQCCKIDFGWSLGFSLGK